MNTPLIRVRDTTIAVSGRFLKIGRIDGDTFKFIDEPEPLIHALRDTRAPVDLFTFMQRLPHQAPMWPYAMEWDNLAVLDVSTFDHWWHESIRVKTRNRARLAKERGVVLREVPFDDTVVAGVTAIYNESPVRQGKPFRHFGKTTDTIARELGTFRDSSVFVGAFVGDALIGFAKLTIDDSRTQAGIMHIVDSFQHRDKATTNALIAEAVRACADRAIPHLVYARFEYAKKRRDTLADFKERNGFRKVELPRYFVPLTRTGRLALRSGLHRRAIDLLPLSIVESGRRLRSAWYARRTRGSERVS